jgi:hypothetical protein
MNYARRHEVTPRFEDRAAFLLRYHVVSALAR